MMINAMKMGREIKTMVGKLDDMQMSERLISVEFFKNMNSIYGEDFTNRVLEAFIDFNKVGDENMNCIFMEDGMLYELYNGREYILDGKDILAQNPMYPSDDLMKELIEEAMAEFL